MDDAIALHDAFSDKTAMLYWDTLPHANLSQTEDFVRGMMGMSPEQGEDFVVEFDGQVIGKAGFWRFPEIGFIFNPDFWGQGFAKEAVSALIDYGFDKKQLTKITADVDPRNERSIRLLEGLGFVETHRKNNTFKVGNEWVDSVYFCLDYPL
ncbi:MAG: GNAT family N-acetyltransferase [Rhizobiaceae bacterium]|nr:GNAT family N-acetyltransferase [Rhizobiaceae bacterium]